MEQSDNAVPINTIELHSLGRVVRVLDQRKLPHKMEYLTLRTYEEAIEAIRNMTVRGAPLIGITGAAAMALASTQSSDESRLKEYAQMIISARPTAVNLAYSVSKVLEGLLSLPDQERVEGAWRMAGEICSEELGMSLAIGEHAFRIISDLYERLRRPVRILTHCNAGALATVGPGTATAGFYFAHWRNIPIKVYADETRPRLQGVMTAWELRRSGIDVELISDNSGGLLMQRGGVDAVFVGADRIALNGDTANKVGTYLKALACADNHVPFYVAAPVSTFDYSARNGEEIEIEERSPEEIRKVTGVEEDGSIREVLITEREQPVWNPAFDITPARLITGFVTNRGIFSPDNLLNLRD